MDRLRVSGRSGFCSTLSIILFKVAEYAATRGRLPSGLDLTSAFDAYLPKGIGINPGRIFFEDPPHDNVLTLSDSISKDLNLEPDLSFGLTKTRGELQFIDYSQLNFNLINPLINHFFSLSELVKFNCEMLKSKYRFDPESSLAVIYRGLGKRLETNVADYSVFVEKVNQVANERSLNRVLLQSDEHEFLAYAIPRIPNSFCFSREAISASSTTKTVNAEWAIDGWQRIPYMTMFLAILNIIAQSQCVVLHSGNVGLWVSLFRGRADDIFQYLSHKEFVYGKLNPEFVRSSGLPGGWCR
jgi:hypothetical protein